MVERNLSKVKEELIVLARNRAADMGANAMWARAPIRATAPRISAYQCP
ncbi:MAG: hypothetical protein CM15mP120_26900 [Pseudomonadota bacterium]|nr:MAG: hypothetical protein CM15mP120_26900 [Pseudomonadota bacterium]